LARTKDTHKNAFKASFKVFRYFCSTANTVELTSKLR